MASASPAASRSRIAAHRPKYLAKAAPTIFIAAVTAGLVVLDVRAGPMVDLAIFYCVPLALAAWVEGLWLSLPLAVVAVMAGHVTDADLQVAQITRYSPLHPVYQDAAHVVMFVAVALVTRFLRRQQDRLAAAHERV